MQPKPALNLVRSIEEAESLFAGKSGQVEMVKSLEMLKNAVTSRNDGADQNFRKMAAQSDDFLEAKYMDVWLEREWSDVDCVLEPFHAAVGAGQSITRQLLDAGWQRMLTGAHQNPGDARTPVDELPAVRLYPPGVDTASEEAWFIELLTVPESGEGVGNKWTRLPLAEGHFGLPTFRFLAITAFDPLPVGNLGIRYARPEMMALANLLEHPEIKPDTMSSMFAGRSIKRSNKDLGRVLAIATLADLDDYRPWAKSWLDALKTCFPNEWSRLALRAGAGLRALLESGNDFEEAYHTCINGLLASQPLSLEALRAAGNRVLGDAVETLEEFANE